MNDSTEKLQRELQAAQRALAEARARCERHDAEHQAATKELEENRSALLFMLEDLEAGRKKVGQAHREWMAALDVVDDPIFLHDKQFRILRCNRAYQQRAGIPFNEIIGQLYYEVFPKTDGPLSSCLHALDKEEEDEEVTVGETICRSRAFSIHDEQGVYLYSVHTLEDITERKQAEDAFQALVGTAVTNVGAAFFHETVRSLSTWLGVECVIVGEIVDGNRVQALAMQLDGKAIEHYEYDLHGTPCDSAAHKGYCEYPEGIRQLFPSDKDLVDMGAESYVGMPVRDNNGKAIGILCALSRHKFVPPPMLKGIFEIIAARTGTEIERKRAEQALRESEKLYRSLFENMLNGFAYCRMIFEDDQPQDFIYLSVNTAFETLTGLKNVAGKKVSEVIPGIRQSDPGLFEIYGRVSLSGKPERFEIYLEALQQWFWISVYSPEKGYFVAVFDVITERKKAELTLIKSEALLNEMGRLAKVGGWEFNVETREVEWTEEVYRIHEVDMAYKPTVDKGIEFYAPASRPIIAKVVQRAIEYGEPYDEELEFITAKGNHRWVRANGKVHQKHGKTITVFGTFQDITERKQAEAAIQHANRALATLSAVNRSLVRAGSEDELLQSICQAIIKQHGYRMAWVGYKQHDAYKSIKIMERAGHDEGYLDAMQLTWAETERGMGPSGRAIRSGTTQLCQDMINDPSYLPWRAAASQRGYASDIALPLTRESGDVFGVLHVYSGETNAFTPAEIDLLEEMAGDLSFGVRSLHTRRERDLVLEQNRQQLVQLQDSLEDTMRAIASIVEMRDPYTAGHQVRVADLAEAIARQMGLPGEQAHAIHLAGTVHDLGKIQIPAEILSKPGKISGIEYSLIKIHPQAGYDILKDINFPWPIAQMVLQHHERLDGSGYPQGLKGDDILLEARILSVADVVEAISAHRPYRAGLGVEAALEEITEQRGIFFDPQVVDACVALFREQGYSFK